MNLRCLLFGHKRITVFGTWKLERVKLNPDTPEQREIRFSRTNQIRCSHCGMFLFYETIEEFKSGKSCNINETEKPTREIPIGRNHSSKH